MGVKGTLANTILQGKVEGEDHEECQKDVKEWTWLYSKEMWREPEDRVTGRKRIINQSCCPKGLNRLRKSSFKKYLVEKSNDKHQNHKM